MEWFIERLMGWTLIVLLICLTYSAGKELIEMFI